MPRSHDQFLSDLGQNREVAEQLFKDLDRQFVMMRKVWRNMDRIHIQEHLSKLHMMVEQLEFLVSVPVSTTKTND